jgi:parallel beta-helix repeat protein
LKVTILKVVVASIMLTLLFCPFILVIKTADAQPSTITIFPDGTVDASSGIQRDGNTYTLTTDLKLPIEVQKNGITLNGANHTLQGPRIDSGLAGITLKASNVAVTNFNIDRWSAGIYGAYNNNTITANKFTDNDRAIALYATDYVISKNIIQTSTSGIYIKDVFIPTEDTNLIINNQISNNYWAFNIIDSNGTTITQNDVTDNDVILALGSRSGVAGYHLIYLNNFVDNQQALHVHLPGPFVSGLSPISPAGNWDNGKMGNYWHDYTTKYSNVSEISNSGIGDTAYLIESEPISWGNGNGGGGIAILGKGVDRYPLISTYSIATSPDNSSPNSSLPIEYVAAVILAVALLITVLITITYLKKHRQN